MSDYSIVRAIHLIAVIVWVGGVTLVAVILIPLFVTKKERENAFALFNQIKKKFMAQARFTTVITGGTGFYLLHSQDGWGRYLSLDYWWLHAMTLAWLLYSLIAFVMDPFVTGAKMTALAERNPPPRDYLHIFRYTQWWHLVFLGLCFLSILGVAIE